MVDIQLPKGIDDLKERYYYQLIESLKNKKPKSLVFLVSINEDFLEFIGVAGKRYQIPKKQSNIMHSSIYLGNDSKVYIPQYKGRELNNYLLQNIKRK